MKTGLGATFAMDNLSKKREALLMGIQRTFVLILMNIKDIVYTVCGKQSWVH